MRMRMGKQDALEMLLIRIDTLLDEEATGLANAEAIDHSTFFAQKSMLAFEIEAYLRDNPTVPRTRVLDEHFVRLRRKLDESKRALTIHIRACRQIVRILSEVHKSEESDGTYCVRGLSRGYRK